MFNIIKSKLIKSVKSKRINIFLLFLVLSFGILILTKLSRSYTNTIAFNIVMKNVPETDIIISDSINVLNISLKTKGFNFLKYYFKKPRINLDFANKINKTDSVYIWNNKTAFSDIISQFDADIDVVNINPDTLRFRYDVNDIKMIPINLNTDINFKEGYDLIDAYWIAPDSVKVVGPKSIVSLLDELETDTLYLKDVQTDIKEVVNLRLQNEKGLLTFSPEKVTVSASVGRFTEGRLKVPVHVKGIPDSLQIKYFPQTVTVSYYTSLINFSSIKVDDFKVECDFSELDSNQSYLIPKVVEEPKNVRYVKINLKQIEFIITE